jgi:hypothetical protein
MSEDESQGRDCPHHNRDSDFEPDSDPDRCQKKRVGEMIAECHRQLLDVDRVITESESQLIVVSESLTLRDDGGEILLGTRNEITGARERIEEAQKRLEELTRHIKSVETQLQGEGESGLVDEYGFDYDDSDGDGDDHGHGYVRNTESSTKQTNPD